MCGRFTLRSAPSLVAKEYELPVLPPYKQRWNIAPTQQILAVRLHDGKPEATMLRWGIIPAWTEDIKKMPLLINAKSETAATKPSFRSAFKRRRCLVVGDGYASPLRLPRRTVRASVSGRLRATARRRINSASVIARRWRTRPAFSLAFGIALNGLLPPTFTPRFAPTWCKRSTFQTIAVKVADSNCAAKK
jgi:putative SOS response-associated peptidase YedK